MMSSHVMFQFADSIESFAAYFTVQPCGFVRLFVDVQIERRF